MLCCKFYNNKCLFQTPSSPKEKQRSKSTPSIASPPAQRCEFDPHNSPEPESSNSRRQSRRSSTSRSSVTSPGIQGMMDSMSSDMTATEQKEGLLAALDKKVQEKSLYTWYKTCEICKDASLVKMVFVYHCTIHL